MTHSNRKVGAIPAGAAIAATLMLAGVGARAEDAPPDLTLRKDASAEATNWPPPAAAVSRRAPRTASPARSRGGFYRDRQGRVMQVSFDFGRRTVAGRRVRAAPHDRRARRRSRPRRSTSASPLTSCRRTGGRAGATPCSTGRCGCTTFGLDVTGFRYDLSHRYNHPLLRITTFVREPAASRSLPERRALHRGAALRDRAARHRGRAVADPRATCRRRWTCGSRRICDRTCACAPGPASRCGSGRGRRRRATSASFRRRRWKGTS